MNIYIPHQWLLEHLNTQIEPEQFSQVISLSGPTIEQIETRETEPVYDIEVTTNRVDSMSIRGIAQEAAAILPESNIKAELKPLKLNYQLQDLAKDRWSDFPLEVENDPELCHRILAIRLKIKQNQESPDWLKKRLLQVGQRSLNPVIDITNYVMWELGHPIHVFDAQAFKTQKLIVRQAKPGETLVTLDNKKHQTNGGEVVFDDGSGNIIDLPGIMGTKNTAVTESTTEVILWLESVPAKLIRQASMGLAIRTQAAILNEKNVDPRLGEPAFLRAIDLIEQVCGAEVNSKLYQTFPHQVKTKACDLDLSQIKRYLGVEIEPKRVTDILERLGCSVETISDKKLRVTPPHSRAHDLEIQPDYIEEIARIYGYHNLGSKLINAPVPDIESNWPVQTEAKIKSWLAGWGWQEVYSYSLINRNQAEELEDKSKLVRLSNSLTEDLEFLRPSHLASHAQIFADNPNHPDWQIFELACVYLQPQDKTELPDQPSILTLSNRDYSQLKMAVDNLLAKLHLETIEFQPEASTLIRYQQDAWASIRSDNQVIGQIGQTRYGFYAAELNFLVLSQLAKFYPKYQPMAKTSPIIEDLTVTLKPQTNLEPVIRKIKQTNDWIDSVELVNQYRDNYSFRLYFLDRETDKQLTKEEVQPLRQKLVEVLESEFQAKLVGKIKTS